MEIIKALPIKKYAAAAAHARTREFKNKAKSAIANIREWVNAPGTNRTFPPAVYFGYGKDSMAMAILLKTAGVKFTALTVLNGADLPAHELVFPDFDRFIGEMEHIIYRPEKRYIEYLAQYIYWGQDNSVTKANGELIDFWDGGSMMPIVYWYTADRYWGEYGDFANDIVIFSGKRGAEAMDRFYMLQRKGAFHRVEEKGGDYTYWAAYPLHDWRDIDIWALLVTHNCPVSEVYSYNEIPQKGGKQSFPRTYWYCEPVLMNAQYYRWMAHYAPAQLKEMIDFFPEIKTRVTESRQAA